MSRILPFLFLLISCLICSCISLDGVYRKPIELSSPQSHLSFDRHNAALVFEQTIPAAPLNETVWDNVRGCYRDTLEARQIGFTQQGSMTFVPIIPIATVTSISLSSQIVIPFGNLFSQVLALEFDSTRTQLPVLFAPENHDDSLLLSKKRLIVSIRVDSFFVWEDPVNHINYYATGKCTLIDSSEAQRHYFEFSHKNGKIKLGGRLSSMGTLLKALNSSANNFAQELSVTIVRQISQAGYFR